MTALLNNPILTYFLGWASGVIFIAGYEAIADMLESRPRFVAKKPKRDPCPWPIDDEVSRAVALTEFHPVFHASQLTGEAANDHA